MVLIRKKGVKSKHYGMSTMYVSLQRFYGALVDYVKLSIEINGAPTLSILYMQRYCRDLMAPQLCQFTEILQRFYGTPTMSIYRDFMVPRLCQFTEISWCPDYVNLQRFHGAPTMSIYRDFAEILRCPDYVNLQRFYGAPTMSIYRDFT